MNQFPDDFLETLIEIGALALLEHHFPGKTPTSGALERARADSRVVLTSATRVALLVQEDDLR